MNYSTLLINRKRYITTIKLNHLEQLNAMNDQMHEEIIDALGSAEDDENVRVVIITGVGRALCAGGDLTQGSSEETLIDQEHPEKVRQRLYQPQSIIRLIRRLDKVVIGMINGPAVGIGFDLASACDLRIASEIASFIVGFTRVGLVPATGGNMDASPVNWSV